jgi:hypothetical protein
MVRGGEGPKLSNTVPKPKKTDNNKHYQMTGWFLINNGNSQEVQDH